MRKAFCLIVVFSLLLLSNKIIFASPMGGFVVNEKSRLCTVDITGDESGNRILGNCKLKDFGGNSNYENPKIVCESHGYKFVSGGIRSICRGLGVGDYFGPSLFFLFVILLILVGILILIIKRKRNSMVVK